MGMDNLSWQEVILGDPLMGPFAEPPSVTITAPADDGVVATGTINIAADTVPVGAAAGISRIEVWIDPVLVRRFGDAYEPDDISVDNPDPASVSVSFDTTGEQTGLHYQVVAIDDSVQRACRVGARSISSITARVRPRRRS